MLYLLVKSAELSNSNLKHNASCNLLNEKTKLKENPCTKEKEHSTSSYEESSSGLLCCYKKNIYNSDENDLQIDEENQKNFIETRINLSFHISSSVSKSFYSFISHKEILSEDKSCLKTTCLFQYFNSSQILGELNANLFQDKIICTTQQNNLSGYTCLLKVFYKKLLKKILKMKIIKKYKSVTGNLLDNIVEVLKPDIEAHSADSIIQIISVLKLLLYDYIKTNFFNICKYSSFLYKFFILGDPIKEGAERYIVLSCFWQSLTNPLNQMTSADIYVAAKLFKKTIKVSQFIKDTSSNKIKPDVQVHNGKSSGNCLCLIYHSNLSVFFTMVDNIH
ncbi:hypothetical protein NUSPORA_01842 [Nucleospora cyclopteri]